VQGDASELEPTRDQPLQRLALAYGHLVDDGAQLSGEQWARLIERHHAQRPGVALHVRHIRQAMLADRFQDDWLLVDAFGAARARGTKGQCEGLRAAAGQDCTLVALSECSAQQLREAQVRQVQGELAAHGARLAGAEEPLPPGFERFDGHPFDERHCVHAPAGRPLAIALSLLQHPSVGVETFTDEQNASDEAAYEAMSAMVRHLGYASFVTARPPGARMRADQPPASEVLDAHGIAQRLQAFMADMLERGWDRSKPVFLCRPAPVVNPTAAVRPFESILHEKLIAWRLPAAVVERVVQRLSDGQEELSEDRTRSLHERA
jgi:hypothetical protein